MTSQLDILAKDINASLPVRKISALIERTNLSADMKALLNDLAGITVRVGSKTLAIGRKILSFTLDLVRVFPTVTLGVLVALVLTALIGAIPLIGGALASMLGSLLLLIGVSAGALNDFMSPNLNDRIERLVSSMSPLRDL